MVLGGGLTPTGQQRLQMGQVADFLRDDDQSLLALTGQPGYGRTMMLEAALGRRRK